MLAWGLLEYPQGYAASGTTDTTLATLKWGTDYMLKCHLTNDSAANLSYVAQVSNPLSLPCSTYMLTAYGMLAIDAAASLFRIL